jgi:predicted CoA-binding protein
MHDCESDMQTVAVIGASEDLSRYSNMACRQLRARGHKVYAISLHGRDIQDAIGRTSVADIPEPLDTATMYIRASLQPAVLDAIIQKKPKRVIFNPGSESKESEQRLREAGIEVVHACTLVLLHTNQFEAALNA